MSRYLSILKTDIREFVSNNRHKTLAKTQEHARRIEIELQTQTKDNRQTPAPSQLAAKRFKHTDSRFGGQKGPRCDKCGKSHEGIF